MTRPALIKSITASAISVTTRAPRQRLRPALSVEPRPPSLKASFKFNRVLCQAAQRDGRPWTRDVLPMAKHLVPQYLTAEDGAEMLPWYEDFALRFGLLLGPAARPGLLRDRLAPAAA